MDPTPLQTAADSILLGFINLSSEPDALPLHHFLGLAATFGQIHEAAMRNDPLRVLALTDWATYWAEGMRSDLHTDWLDSIKVLRLAAAGAPAEQLPRWAQPGRGPLSFGGGPLPMKICCAPEDKKLHLRLVK